LLDVLASLLRLDLAGVRMRPPPDGCPEIDDRYPRDAGDPPELLERALAGPARGEAISNVVTPDHVEGRDPRVIAVERDLFGTSWRVVAASYRPTFPTETERFLLSFVVEQAALAVETSVHLVRQRVARDAAERARAEIEAAAEAQRRRLEQLRALADAAVAINREPGLDQKLAIINERAQTIVGTHLAMTSLTRGPDGSRAISAIALSDKYAHYRGHSISPDGAGIHRLVCEQNRPYRMTQSELEAHEVWRGFGLEVGRYLPVRGWLAVPLTERDGGNLGLIQLSDKVDGDEFSAEDEAILVQVAQMASVAIENARLLEAERAAVRARDVFLSIAAHELRTPVTAIKGTAQVALRAKRQGRLDLARAVRSLQSIEQTSNRFATIIDDLLDVSHLQSGQFALRTERLELVALLRGVAERCVEQIDPGYLLETELPDEPILVEADARRLEQVFDNLLSNAVKYSPAGGTVEVTLARDEENANVAISDPGIGLPPGAAETIFEPFGRAENAAVHNVPGMGLGLYICRNIVERHGGKIWAESDGEGRGTTVRVVLPVIPADATPTIIPKQADADE
jgi:signal transduction histidine kinase